MQSPSPTRSANFKKKKAFKNEQQLELERQRQEVEAFEQFVVDYEKPREEVPDPGSQIELYKLRGVEEIIQLADHLVKYRERKNEEEQARIANMPEHERRTLDMVITARKPTRPITIKRVGSTSPQKSPLEAITRKLPSQTSQKSVHRSLDRRVSKKLSLRVGKAVM